MTDTATSALPESDSLGRSARSSLLWGGGFTLLRDVAQFGTMLILVRLLNPEDYGTAALAQAIVGVVSAISINTFSGHALQIRDPKQIDWQAHFTAAAFLNTALAGIVLLLALALSLTAHYRDAAMPLAALAVVFLIEIPAVLRHRMLEANHDWTRFRLLLIIGTLLGLGSGLLVALSGGGVWALIVQVPMLGLPAAVDLLVVQRFRPDWTWSWPRWRETLRFGIDRIGSGLVGRSRVLSEQIWMSGLYDLATLGIFSRAMGLAALLAGRIGSVAMLSLAPVITRAEVGSPRFQRLAGLVLRGVVWTTLPAAMFLCLASRDTVALLYGPQWGSVAPLLPLAALTVGLGGIATALSSLLVANDDSRAALGLDAAAAASSIGVAIALLPFGAQTYLAGLSVHALLFAGAAVVLLHRRGAITAGGVAAALIPAVAACLAGVAAVLGVRHAGGSSLYMVVRLSIEAVIFGLAYLAALRLAFPGPLAEIVNVLPASKALAHRLRLKLAG